MKKSKYVDYAVILAALSNRKKRRMEKLNTLTSRPMKSAGFSTKKHTANVAA